MGVRAKRVLTDKQLDAALGRLPEWRPNSKRSFIKATFRQPDYITGLVFIARIAVYAELAAHHPDITFSYGEVSVKLTTHDVKGLTKADIDLATKISKLTTHR
jgi:4a-hydroxytetrahydrobiopterin dehydratase